VSIPSEIPGCDYPDQSKVSIVDGHCRCVVCSRCNHHTGNNHQGHYWRKCKVTGTMRVFHFCCPGDCELEATIVTEAPAERTGGPVDSALSQLLNHIEVAMWSEGVDLEVTNRVLNKLAFGHATGGPSGRLEDIPGWATELATQLLGAVADNVMLLPADAMVGGAPAKSQPADAIRMVVLALARWTIRMADPVEQALRG